MARQGITRDQVFTAADALVGDGQQPTINAIRERLGGTGSPNTIHKHLVQWREARPVAAVAAPELPQALTAAIAGEIEKAAAKSRAEKEQELQQAQAEAAELGAAGEALEAERDELAEQVAVLTTERDTLAGKAAQQAADLAEAQQRIEREREEESMAALEHRLAELRAAQEADATQPEPSDDDPRWAAFERTFMHAAQFEHYLSLTVLAAPLAGLKARFAAYMDTAAEQGMTPEMFAQACAKGMAEQERRAMQEQAARDADPKQPQEDSPVSTPTP